MRLALCVCVSSWLKIIFKHKNKQLKETNRRLGVQLAAAAIDPLPIIVTGGQML